MAGTADPLILDLACEMSAPAGRVFEFLTTPSELRRWWGPSGFTTPEIELDLRVGGRYRLGMQPPEGDPFHLSGEYLVVDPPRRLTYTFRWDEPDPDDRETLVELTLDPLPDGTRVRLRQATFTTEARLALHRSGWTDSFQKLQNVVAGAAE